jgi:hypothetical protein
VCQLFAYCPQFVWCERAELCLKPRQRDGLDLLQMKHTGL